MTARNFRFRPEGQTLVLQIEELAPYSPFWGQNERNPAWRDAKTEDMLEVARLLASYEVGTRPSIDRRSPNDF